MGVELKVVISYVTKIIRFIKSIALIANISKITLKLK